MSKLNKEIDELKGKINLVLEKVGTLTKVQRLIICLLTFAVIGGTYYYFIFMPKNEELEKLEKNLTVQMNKLANYKKRAAKILFYEKKMAATMVEFNQAMKALPEKKEIPSLLTAISKVGSNSGLDFLLFQPEKEVNKEFYKEIPVSIKISGAYHQVTNFLFQITKLNRIVNINNVDIKGKKGGSKLEMSCKAVTYMFIEKKEPEKKNKRKRKKK